MRKDEVGEKMARLTVLTGKLSSIQISLFLKYVFQYLLSASHALAGSFVRAPSRAEPLQYLLRVYCWVFSLSKVEALTICLFIYGSPLFYTFIIIPTNRFSDECQVQRVNHILPAHGIHPFAVTLEQSLDHTLSELIPMLTSL
jgi:hypothetical protein